MPKYYFGCIDTKTGNANAYSAYTERGGHCHHSLLPPRNDIRNHSPTGFQWGYGGSGPAQLALAILADHLADHLEDDIKALRLYQDFKSKVIAALPQGKPWQLTPQQIDAALKAEA